MIANKVEVASQGRKTQTAFHSAVVPCGDRTSDDKVLTTEDEDTHPDVVEVVDESGDFCEHRFVEVTVGHESSRAFNEQHKVDEKADSNYCSCDSLDRKKTFFS